MDEGAASPAASFGFRSCLGSSWAVVRDHWFALVMAGFLTHLLPVVAGCLAFAAFIDFPGWNMGAGLTAGLVSGSALYVGFLRFCLGLCETGKAEWKALFSGLAFTLEMLTGTVCFWGAVACGSILLVIPGLIFATRFSLYAIALADQGLTGVDSLSASQRLLKGYFWYPVGFFLVCWAGDEILMGVKMLAVNIFKGGPGLELLLAGTSFEPLLIISLCMLYKQARRREAGA